MIRYEDVRNKLVEKYDIDEKEIEEKYREFREEIRKEFPDEDEENVEIKTARRLLKYYKKIIMQIRDAEDISGVILGIIDVVDYNEVARRKSEDGTYPEGWVHAGEPIPDEPAYNVFYIVWDGRTINKLRLTGELANQYAMKPEELLGRSYEGKGFKKEDSGMLVYTPLTLKINGREENIWDKIETIPVFKALMKGDNEIVSVHADVLRVTVTKNSNIIVELTESYEDRGEIEGEKIIGFSKWLRIPDTDETIKVIGRIFRREDDVWMEIYGASKYLTDVEKKEDMEEVDI